MDDAKKTSAYADLMRLVNGYQISQAIHVAVSSRRRRPSARYCLQYRGISIADGITSWSALSIVACTGFRGRSSRGRKQDVFVDRDGRMPSV